MVDILVTRLLASEHAVEVVERKGIGHPDTICDALAEQLSRDLCAAYLARFGEILHHNVDKALLCGGRAVPGFGGGRVERPIEIYLAGRASGGVAAHDIAVDGALSWLRTHLHQLDPAQHVRITPVLQEGSPELRTLVRPAGGSGTPLCNDTSIGVGYAPLSALERLVLRTEQALLGEIRSGRRLAWGEDIKVMAVRRGPRVELTIACAQVGAHLTDADAYFASLNAVADLARRAADDAGFESCAVTVNAADNRTAGDLYLTVTGTSAEGGDDGQVGRGNRINGLITPGRPMSLEAAAGKNPVSHVGKIYNVAARVIADRIVSALPDVRRAECLLVSRIGAPITEPAVAEVRIEAPDGGRSLDAAVRAIARNALSEIPSFTAALLAGRVDLF